MPGPIRISSNERSKATKCESSLRAATRSRIPSDDDQHPGIVSAPYSGPETIPTPVTRSTGAPASSDSVRSIVALMPKS